MSIITAPAPRRNASRPVRWVRPAPAPERMEEYEEWASRLDADTRAEMEAQYNDPWADTDPADWPAWTDQEIATLAPLSLAAYIATEADRFAAMDTAAADLIAEAIRGLARLVALTQAETPAQYIDRIEAYGDSR